MGDGKWGNRFAPLKTRALGEKVDLFDSYSTFIFLFYTLSAALIS